MPLLSDDEFGVSSKPSPKLLSDDEFGVATSTPTARPLSDDEFGVEPTVIQSPPLTDADRAQSIVPTITEHEPTLEEQISRDVENAGTLPAADDADSRYKDFMHRYGSDRLKQIIETPLWDYLPEDVKGQLDVPGQLAQAAAAARARGTPDVSMERMAGAAEGLANVAKGFTSPYGMLAMGTGSLEPIAAKTASLVFAADMARQTPELARQLGTEMGKPEDERDQKKIASLITQWSAIAGFSGLAAAHGATPTTPEIPEARPETEDTAGFFAQNPKSGAIAPVSESDMVPEAQADTSPAALADLQSALRGNQGNLKPEQRPESEQVPENGEQLGQPGEQVPAPIRMPGRDMLEQFRAEQNQLAEKSKSPVLPDQEGNPEQAQASVAPEGPKPSVPASPAPVGDENLAQTGAIAPEQPPESAAAATTAGRESPADSAENWIRDQQKKAAQTAPGSFSPDSALKVVSKWIRAGETPEGEIPPDTMDALMRSLPPTRDMETGEMLQAGDPDWPRTGTLLDFLDGRSNERVPDEKQETASDQAGAAAAKGQPGFQDVPEKVLQRDLRAQADPVMDWLNGAIDKTDPLRPLREGEVGMAFPKWATQTVINSALKVVRAAYSGGKRLAAAVQDGVEYLRQQNLPGFDQDEAHVALLKAMHSGEGETPLAEIEARREQIQKRLAEMDSTRRQPGVKLSPELRSERFQLVKEMRGLDRQRVTNPDYVRDVFRRMEKLTSDLQIANQAGNGLHAREIVDELQSIMDGELPRIPEDLKKRIYDEMVAKGEINKSAMKEMPAGRSLDDLTAWLKANGADSPGVPLRERLNLAKKLSDQFNAGKDTLAKAWGNLRAGWEAFKAQYKSPPKDDDFRSLMKDWFFEKQWTGLETHKWVQQIRDAVPQKIRREAIGVYLDAHGDEQLLRSQADTVKERYKAVWETAMKLTSKEKALARRIQLDFEQKLSDGQGLGLIDRGRAEYGLPQLWKVKPKYEGEYDPADPQWKRPQTPRKPGARLDPGDPFFALQRNVPSYFDGIMADGHPVTMDVGDMVGHYNAEFHDALADRGVIKNLKDAKAPDGQPAVMISGAARREPREAGQSSYFVDSNWRPKDAVTADGRPYQPIDHWALRGWKFASVDAEGNPILVHGDFLVHPDYYKFLKNELGKSVLRDPDGPLGDVAKLTNAMLNSTAWLKANKFANATFHMATLAEHSITHAFSGMPGKERFSLLSPLTRGIELDPGRDLELARLMRAGTNLGFDGSRELFEEGLASHGGLWGKVPGLGSLMTHMSDFLFKQYMPALKVKTAKVLLHSNLERYAGKLSEDQIYELTAQQANAAFGAQQNKLAWTALGRNKTLLDVNRLLFTAPDFLLSRMKVVGQALKPYNREQRLFLLAQAGLVYTGARAANALLSKDHNPHWEPWLWDKVVIGNRAYSSRFLVSDIGHMVQDPVDFAAGRVGPYPKTAIDAIVQRDWRTGSRIGVPIETDNRALRAAEIIGKDLGSWLVPVGAEGFLPGAPVREQTKGSQVAQALLGLGSRKYTPETQMHGAAADFNRGSNDPAAQTFQKTRDAEAHVDGQYRKLDDLLDAGDMDAARKEFEALRAEGHTEQGFERHFADRPFTGNTQREGKFRQSLSDADQKVYQQAIADRQARRQAFGKMLQTSTASR